MIDSKKKKKSKTVHIITTMPKPQHKYIHMNVKEYYREGEVLVIIENESSRQYVYAIDKIKEIRVKEVTQGEYWRNPIK